MNHRLPTILALTCALVVTAVGCGESQQPTASTPAQSAEQPATTSSSTTTTPETKTTSTPEPTTTETTGSGSSSSGGQPAFVEAEKSVEGLAGAEAALRAHGYEPVETATYKPAQTLRVLVGSGHGGQNAFFFIGNRYIGTDSKTSSTHVTVAKQSEGSVTLRYSLYREGRPAGSANVTFELENGNLQPQQQIPAASARNAG